MPKGSGRGGLRQQDLYSANLQQLMRERAGQQDFYPEKKRRDNTNIHYKQDFV
jgi:hypothetical protein